MTLHIALSFLKYVLDQSSIIKIMNDGVIIRGYMIFQSSEAIF